MAADDEESDAGEACLSGAEVKALLGKLSEGDLDAEEQKLEERPDGDVDAVASQLAAQLEL